MQTNSDKDAESQAERSDVELNELLSEVPELEDSIEQNKEPDDE
jgi:hypothetical protein